MFINWINKYISPLRPGPKSLLIAVAVFLLITGVFLPVSMLIQENGFRSLETSSTDLEVQQVKHNIDSQLQALDASLTDWSFWDDTYAFAENPNNDYIAKNLSITSMSATGANLMVLVNTSGQVLFAKSIDLEKKIETPLPFDAAEFLRQHPELLDLPDTTSQQGGVVLLPGGEPSPAMLIVSRPILDSLDQGPIHGTLIYGLYLNQQDLASSIPANNVVFDLRARDDASLPRDFKIADADLQQRAVTAVQPQDQNTVAGYTYLKDISGKSSIIMKVSFARDIYNEGQRDKLLFGLAILILALAFTIVIRSILNKYYQNQLAEMEAMGRYQAVIQQTSDAILLVALENQRILYANPACERLLGQPLGEIMTMTLSEALGKPQSEIDQDTLFSRSEGQHAVGERNFVRRDGRPIEVDVSSSFISFSGQQQREYRVLSIVLRDITERKRVEVALRESEERYQLATRGANDGLWDWNLLTNQVYYSNRWKQMLGFEDKEISDSPDEWFQRVHPDDLIELKHELSGHWKGRTGSFSFEYRIRHKNGEYLWMLSRGQAIWKADGYAYRMAGSQTDITARRKIEEQLRYDALHDALTRLPNRTLLLDRIRHAIERTKRQKGISFGVLFLDFDRFKMINDSLGHAAGDQFLLESSTRLQKSLRSVDTVARLAGDEFVILLEDLHGADEVEEVARRVQDVFKTPFVLEGQEIFLSVSIGIVMPGSKYSNAEAILRDADIAMFFAKRSGGQSRAVFNESMYDRTVERMELETDLRLAMERQEFQPYYQPIYSLENEKIIGFEALIRWFHPTRGLIMPGQFIPIAEDTGLIIPIGRWVLQQACLQVKDWRERFQRQPPLIASVNLSSRQFMQANLLDEIKIVLQETGFPPQALWLEVTESMVMQDPPAASKILAQLRDLGIRVEIDDFGTGYSSLSYLQSLPIDGIKIDRSFISNMKDNSSNRQIVQTIIHLASSLGFHVIAEGVETKEQCTGLVELECQYAQGYLFSRPVEAQAIEKVLRGTISPPTVPLPRQGS